MVECSFGESYMGGFIIPLFYIDFCVCFKAYIIDDV